MTEHALDDDERAELERLRRERTGKPPRLRRVARWFASGLVLLVAALLAMATVAVVIARDELLDTDRYVATVAPLAKDPDVRAAVADRLTEAINTHLDVERLVGDAVDSVRTRGASESLDALTGPMTAAVEGFVADQVTAIVDSDGFARLWTTINEVAHREIAALLAGQRAEKLSVSDGMLYVDLGPVLAEVQDRLVERGLTVAAKLPELSVTYPLMDVSGLVKLRGVADLLDTLAWVLPTAVALLLAVAVFAAPDRRRGVLAAALALAAAMAVLLAAIAVARTAVVADLPATVESPEAATAAFDIVTRILVDATQTILVLALIAVVVAWALGPGRAAGALRGGLAWLVDSAAAGLRRTGLNLDSVSGFFHRNRTALEVTVVALGLLWLVLWQHRGVGGVLWVAAAGLVAVTVVEILGRIAVEPDSARRDPRQRGR